MSATAAVLPAGACDCHFHIFEAARYPYSPARHYTPQDAPMAEYLALCERFGIARSVLVHPTVFGGDHRSFEAILREQGDRMRGVAVVSPDTPEDVIARWHDLGARGTRIVLLGTEPDLPAIESIVGRVRPFGWHLQVLVDVVQHPKLVTQLLAFRVPVVFDHMGHHRADALYESAGFANLLAHLKEGTTWVKLSAPYRLAPACHLDGGVRRVAASLVAANPARVVWGTDWPHPSSPHPVPGESDLFSLLFDLLPDAALREQVLVHNARRLYWADQATS